MGQWTTKQFRVIKGNPEEIQKALVEALTTDLSDEESWWEPRASFIMCCSEVTEVALDGDMITMCGNESFEALNVGNIRDFAHQFSESDDFECELEEVFSETQGIIDIFCEILGKDNSNPLNDQDT